MDRRFLEKQLDEFRETLEEDAPAAYRRYGVTLLHSLDEETYFKELARFGWQPETALDFYNQGVIAANRGDHEQALELYQEALKRDPELPCALFNLACSCEALGRSDQQRTALKKYVDLLSKRERRELSEQEAADLDAAREALASLKA